MNLSLGKERSGPALSAYLGKHGKISSHPHLPFETMQYITLQLQWQIDT